LRSFILVMEKSPEFRRQEIDRGTIHRDAVSLVNCVRSSLFTSLDVRRDTSVIICPLDHRGKLVRIDGKELRYMGPDERSISILLSLAFDSLASKRVGNEVSSPGITVVREMEPFATLDENSLFLCQFSEGLDLRKIKFTRSTTFVLTQACESRFRNIEPFMNKPPPIPIAIRNVCPIERTILIINNEMDRQLGNR
jgi:tRNA pseudouridine-54 N-methylase